MAAAVRLAARSWAMRPAPTIDGVAVLGVRAWSSSPAVRASADLPRRDNDLALETIHGRTVHVVDDPEYSFRLLNNMLTAEGLPRYLKAKEFAQAPGISRRLRKKEQRRRIAREEANKRILQVLDPEGWNEEEVDDEDMRQ